MATNLIVQIEVTDTYGGEANYSWVKHRELRGLEGKSDLAIVRAVKKEIDWTNIGCKVEKYGDMIRLTPYRTCVTCFITFTYESAS